MKLIQLGFKSLIKVTPFEIREFQDRIQQQKKEWQYKLAEIVLRTSQSANPEKLEHEVSALYRQIKEGGVFRSFAQQFSQSASALRGGDIGWCSYDQIINTLKKPRDELMLGSVHLVSIPGGWKIIKILDIQPPHQSPMGQTQVDFIYLAMPQPPEDNLDHEFKVKQLIQQIFECKNCQKLESFASQHNIPIAKQSAMLGDMMTNFQEKTSFDFGKINIGSWIQSTDNHRNMKIFRMVCQKKEPKIKELTSKEIEGILIDQKLGARSDLELKKHRKMADIRIISQEPSPHVRQ